MIINAKGLTPREAAEMTFIHHLVTQIYPSGVVSVVSDTFDYWTVITNLAARLKEDILARTPNALGLAKVVFRPDSGDPADILCGTARPVSELEFDSTGRASPLSHPVVCNGKYYINSGDKYHLEYVEVEPTPEMKGSVQCLWDIFGGTTNELGYKTLNQRVGLIYGDSITLERARDILQRLKDKGFASDNVVFGIGLNRAPLQGDLH